MANSGTARPARNASSAGTARSTTASSLPSTRNTLRTRSPKSAATNAGAASAGMETAGRPGAAEAAGEDLPPSPLRQLPATHVGPGRHQADRAIQGVRDRLVVDAVVEHQCANENCGQQHGRTNLDGQVNLADGPPHDAA